MGLWLMPLPETFFTGTVTVPRYRDFDPLVKEVSYLEDSFLIGQPQYGSPVKGRRFLGVTPALAGLMENGWPSIDQLEGFVSSQQLPAWSVELRFYGPEETVRANWEAAKRRFKARVPGAGFQDGELVRLPLSHEAEAAFPLKPHLGIPALEIFNMVARNPLTDSDPPDGHADFFTIVPRKAESVWAASQVLAETYREMGLPLLHDPFTTPINYYSRCFIVATVVPTWRDPAKNASSRKLFSRIIDRVAEHNWGTYRTAPAFQGQAVSKFSYNNSSLLRFQEKLKDSIDPNGIISPGRYGIWPAGMRKGRA
jgi:4-cresol dehydrogenase (hydroxylating)